MSSGNAGRILRERIAASPDAVLVLAVLATFMDMMISGPLIPVFPEYAPRLGVDESIPGIIFGVYATMLLFFSIPMGLLSDRVGRRLSSGSRPRSQTSSPPGWSRGFRPRPPGRRGGALLADTTDPSMPGERMGIALGPVIGGLPFE